MSFLKIFTDFLWLGREKRENLSASKIKCYMVAKIFSDSLITQYCMNVKIVLVYTVSKYKYNKIARISATILTMSV